ncbi:hypothetical protein D3C72_2103940 [compost metagenome]
MVEHDRVAADIPARLQADPGMNRADRADLRHIVGAEVSLGYVRPVVHLRALGAADMLVGAEEATYVGCLAQLRIELVEPLGQFPVDQRLQAADALPVALRQLHEIEPLLDTRAR